LLPQAIEQSEQITLNYDDDIISFEFAALSFLHQRRIVIVTGWKGWRRIGTRSRATVVLPRILT
jgi:hypothetical protein